jgi:hypothetical protein
VALLASSRIELHRPGYADLEAEVAQGTLRTPSREERISFIASRSLLPSGQGKSVRFLPDIIH